MILRKIRLQHIGVLIGSVTLLGLYQNFDVIKLPISKVNQQARSSHARELLGRSYKGSNAQKAEKVKNLHASIYTKLYENLPPNYKKKSTLLAQTIIEQSEFYDIDPVLVLAMIETESKFNPLARGSFREIGLLQIKPDTAQWIAEREGIIWKGPNSLEDPVTNIHIGMAYINYLRTTFEGSANKYLSAYNMGARNVRRLYASEIKPQEYSLRVMKNYQKMYSQIAELRADRKIADN